MFILYPVVHIKMILENYQVALRMISDQPQEYKKLCSKIHTKLFYMDCLYFSIETYAQKGNYIEARRICDSVQISKDRSECFSHR